MRIEPPPSARVPRLHGLTRLNQDAISVVITTFERPEACERALTSALDQADEPLEVLICDDGSSDDTPTRFREWERRHEKVRYLRAPTNTGTPAAARNLGIAHARGSWIAFLDDDDEWLPEKLARQRAAIATETADVIATNALRSDGSVYFPDAPPTHRPTRGDLLRTNPIITSSAVVRRSFAGFPETVWMRGIEDYAAWLALADRGARFLVLGEPLLRYQDASSERLSVARAYRELAVARLAWKRAVRRPIDAANLRAAVRKTAGAVHVVRTDTLAAARTRARRRSVRSN
jgi:glycosyltransferase involved in cell wall biosynthesis